MFPLAYRLATALVHKMPIPSGKLAVTLGGQHSAVSRWSEWASINRTKRPLVWVHGASVGENLSAVPILSRLRAAISGLQVVHSYTSPSARAWHHVFRSDYADFLPPDLQGSIAGVLEDVRPDLLIFSRGDLWPVMIRTTAGIGVPVALIAGTVSKSSRRLWPPVQRALRSTYKAISWIGAVSQGDADRLVSLGADEDAVFVTGDPRNDQVLERSCDLSVVSPFLPWSGKSHVLVAGSTDMRDENVLLSAFSRIVKDDKLDTRLVLVPHHVSENRVGQILEIARKQDVAVAVWNGQTPPNQIRCVVAQEMGVLADLYALADLAYVGGGFKRNGLHAVIEPAAFAVPVIAGPEHESSHAFQLLLDADGADSLPKRGASDRLSQMWVESIANPQMRLERGLQARRTLQQGAATSSANALLDLIAPSTE